MPTATDWKCCRCHHTWTYALYAACLSVTCQHKRCHRCTPLVINPRPKPKARQSADRTNRNLSQVSRKGPQALASRPPCSPIVDAIMDGSSGIINTNLSNAVVQFPSPGDGQRGRTSERYISYPAKCLGILSDLFSSLSSYSPDN